MAKTVAVVMAGGAGTRFWPASRSHLPKQLLPLGADPDESLIRATVRRLAPLIPARDVYIATGAHLLEATARELPEVPRAQLLAEPIPRNTAPCIGWAAAVIARTDPEALVAVLPSDHFIKDEEAFRATIARAFEGARAGYLTTIGIVPSRPETGYGYVEIGEEVAPGVLAAKRFVEKPDRARAEEYVASKRFLWNAGMFFFRAGVMLEAIRAQLPALAEGLEKLDRAARDHREDEELKALFPTFQSISIDHGVMEKHPKVAVVPGDFGWNDVGSWESAWELGTHDEKKNAAPAGSVVIDASGNLIRSLSSRAAEKCIALVGVHDLVVVDTDDALLVMPRERAQDVRAVVDALKARGDHKKL